MLIVPTTGKEVAGDFRVELIELGYLLELRVEGVEGFAPESVCLDQFVVVVVEEDAAD